jgi:nicotinamidase-related amidase
MKNIAMVVIDLQNDITKNYRKIIGQVNEAIDWAVANEMHVIYIRHYNLTEKTRTFKPGTKGSELVPELKVVSENVFEKSKASALTSEAFSGFIEKNGIDEFYITGADATGCVKSTSYNLVKAGYKVHTISDCITSYDLKKLDAMYTYYADKGCEELTLKECMGQKEA